MNRPSDQSAQSQPVPQRQETSDDRLASKGSMVVWAGATLASLVFVAVLGFSSPFADEWRFVDVICGEQPMSWQWLFQTENQHCAPLFKLAYMGLGYVTHFDFRLDAMVNVVLLSGLAWVLMRLAARLRGRASLLDVVYPVTLLHWGHCVNLLWGFQLFYTLPVTLSGIGLALMVSAVEPLSLGISVGVCACFAGAAFCGGPGIFYTLPVSLWLVYGAVRRWRRGRRRDGAIVVAIIVSSVLPLVPLLLHVPDVGFVARSAPASGNLGLIALRGALQLLSGGVGKIGCELWPASAIGVLAALGTAAWWLLRAWLTRPEERLRVVGLGLFFCGVVGLALGVALSRSHLGPKACLESRYYLLACFWVLAFALTAARYAPAIRNGRWSVGLAAIVVAVGVGYALNNWGTAQQMHGRLARMERLVQEGLPVAAVASRCAVEAQQTEASLTVQLEMLRRAGLSPYRRGATVADERQACVRPLAPLPIVPALSKVVRLASGEQLTQPIPAGTDLPLYRIEFEVREDACSVRRVQPFGWTLESIGPGGQHTRCAEGICRFQNSPDYDYAILEFPPTSVPHDRPLELTLRGGSSAASGAPLRVTLYRNPSGNPPETLRGFLYFGEIASGAQAPSQSPHAGAESRR